MTRTKKIIATVAIALTGTLGAVGVASAHGHGDHGGRHGHNRHYDHGLVHELVRILDRVL
jgi:hypothetical protein